MMDGLYIIIIIGMREYNHGSGSNYLPAGKLILCKYYGNLLNFETLFDTPYDSHSHRVGQFYRR